MSIKRIFGVLSLILLSAPVMPGIPSTLASAGTQCTIGETRTVDCHGPVNGQQPTGPFSAKFEGDRVSGTMGVTPIDGDCASKQTTCRCAGWWFIWRCAVK
jgi:hypothetical protein